MIERQNIIIEGFESPSDLAFPTGLSAPSPPRLSHSLLLLLLFAIALGSLLAVFATLSLMWVAVVCVGFCGVFVALLWRSANWLLAPVLRAVLLASFLFKLEVNLFPDFKYNESPPGLNISLMLIVSLMLLGAHILNRWRGKPRDSVFPLGYSLASMTLLLCCVLSILDCSEPLFGFYAVWGLTTVLLMCFVVANEFGSRAALRAAVIVMALGFGVNGLVALLQSTTGMFTDWSGRDFSCTPGVTPVPQLCNATTVGRVAVCWPNRRTGECGGATAWCTYKIVSIHQPGDGAAPGRVYECTRQN